MTTPAPPKPPAGVAAASFFSRGRPFVHPLFDYALIGGGLSLLLVPYLRLSGRLAEGAFPVDQLPVFVLLANCSHFAASTVRLYTKPGSFRELPFLTMAFPLLTLAVLSIAILLPASLGRNLNALYMTWSPYHYAAQTYGLTVMYAMRSGCALGERDRSLLWWTCMLPFGFAFVNGAQNGSGIAWFVSPATLAERGEWGRGIALVGRGLVAAMCIAPAAIAVRLRRRGAAGLPVISWLLPASNAVWWVVFSYLGAFGWATVFHGVQYLAIVTVFHLRDHSGSGNAGRWLRSTAKFYGACLLLGYLMFEAWPYAYVAAGFRLSESMLLCTATINIHHFVVDRYIWRLRRDPNYRIVVDAAPQAA